MSNLRSNLHSKAKETGLNIEIAKILDKYIPANGIGTKRERLRMNLMNELLMCMQGITQYRDACIGEIEDKDNPLVKKEVISVERAIEILNSQHKKLNK